MSFLPYSQINNGISPAYSYFNEILFSSPNQTQTLVFPGTFLPSTYYFSAFMKIYAASGLTGCKIGLPDPTFGAPGNSALFYNTGEENISIVDNLGAQIVLLAPSSVWSIVLSANNKWDTFQLGLTASQINAEALTGLGLIALNAQLNLNVPILSKTDIFTIDNTYRANLISWVGGSETVPLPIASTFLSGFFFYFKNNSSGLFTFSTDPLNTIDGSSALILSPNQSCMIFTDTTNWYTEGLGTSVNSSGVKLTPQGIQVVSGSSGSPSYSYVDAQNTGFFLHPSNENMGVTISGSETCKFTPNGVDYLDQYAAVTYASIGGIPLPYLQQLVSF